MVRVNWNVRRKFGRGIEIENWKVGERKKRGYGFWTETGNFCSDKAGYSKPPLPQALLRQFGQTVLEKFVT